MPALTVAVTVNVTVSPAATVPCSHSIVAVAEPKAQPGLAELKTSCGTRTSVITTSCAADGPLLVTLRVNVTGAPGATVAGDEVFVKVRSAAVATGAVTVAALLARSGSAVAEVMVAVFERAPRKMGPACPRP